MLSEPDARRVIEEVFPIPRRRMANTDPIGPYLDALTVARLGLRTRPRSRTRATTSPASPTASSATASALPAQGAVDFDEQIYGAVEALLRDGAFRRRVQPEHRHMLVDEFQDLTPAHVLMIRLLAMPAGDVFGVGDDDQTIYDHAGADPRFLVDYARFFPGAEATALEVNYRCAGGDRRRGGEAARLQPRPGAEGDPRRPPGADSDPAALEIRTHPSAEAASSLVELVRGWLARARRASPRRDRRAHPGQLAAAGARRWRCWSAGVPVASAVRGEVLERTGTAAALAWIRVAVDPDGLLPSDLETIRRRPSRGFPRWISKWLAQLPHARGPAGGRPADRRRAGRAARSTR